MPKKYTNQELINSKFIQADAVLNPLTTSLLFFMEELRNHVMNNPQLSLEEYKFHIGKYQGLQLALTKLLDNVEKFYNEEDEENKND